MILATRARPPPPRGRGCTTSQLPHLLTRPPWPPRRSRARTCSSPHTCTRPRPSSTPPRRRSTFWRTRTRRRCRPTRTTGSSTRRWPGTRRRSRRRACSRTWTSFCFFGRNEEERRGWRRGERAGRKKKGSVSSLCAVPAPAPNPPPARLTPPTLRPRYGCAGGQWTIPPRRRGGEGGRRARAGRRPSKKKGVGATPPDVLRRRPLARATLSPPPFRGLPCADPATRPVPWQEDREVPPSWACRVVDVGVGFGRARGPLSDDAPGLGQKKKGE